MPLTVTKPWMPCATFNVAPAKANTKPTVPSQPVRPHHHQAHNTTNPTNKRVSMRRSIAAATIGPEEDAMLPWRYPHTANSAPPSAAPAPPHRPRAETVNELSLVLAPFPSVALVLPSRSLGPIFALRLIFTRVRRETVRKGMRPTLRA